MYKGHAHNYMLLILMLYDISIKYLIKDFSQYSLFSWE